MFAFFVRFFGTSSIELSRFQPVIFLDVTLRYSSAKIAIRLMNSTFSLIVRAKRMRQRRKDSSNDVAKVERQKHK